MINDKRQVTFNDNINGCCRTHTQPSNYYNRYMSKSNKLECFEISHNKSPSFFNDAVKI